MEAATITPDTTIADWRNQLKTQRAALEQTFLKDKNPARLLKQHTGLIDKLLQDIWQHSHLSSEICLIAVGGYGRQALFPHSDIDLLILVPEAATDAQNMTVETVIGTLWDIGLNIGHSVRSVQACVQEAAADVSVQTNLLEARLLCGPKAVYADFYITVMSSLNAKAFLSDKLTEQKQRHAKFNDTAYKLEPNIKESPGGLRDLHTILWIAQSQGLGNTWQALRKKNIISQKEFNAIQQHEQTLNTLRIRLHYLAKRREDRLLFDFQNQLAMDLGLVNTSRKRASEQMMQRYYRSVRYISLINEIVIKSFVHNSAPRKQGETISEGFIAQNDLLELATTGLFQTRPSAILECFLLLQQNPELQGFGPILLRQLQTANRQITKAFRASTTHQQLFLSILKQKDGVHHSISRMNRYGVLGKYITAFGKIIGQMQHDLFHVYTVDAHTINVLANLRRFSKPELQHEFPLCSRLFSEFEKPHLLYIAAIFHDIAKGRGGDHSELGKADARRFCKLHQLSKEDTALVAWLVEMHLQLSKVAQKSDLSDPAVIEQFAKKMDNEVQLIALYLLTVADIRGTSPTVWNAWKARLLESLFLETRQVLSNESFNVKKAIDDRKHQASVKLRKYGIAENSYRVFWEAVGDLYFSRYNSNEIAWQTRLLIPHVHAEKPIVRAHLSREGDGIEVMIYTKNQRDLFARICNFFDRLGYSIGQAKIYTTHHDYAIDTFIIIDQSTKDISYSGLLKHIEEKLSEKILSTTPIEAPIKGRLSRQVKHMPIKTEVAFSAVPESGHLMLDITTSDCPGLLASIAFIFIEHDIVIHNAKINTLGNRAEDAFLISDRDNKPLNQAKINALKADLIKL